MRIVQKFGGSSLADRERLLRAAGRILAAKERGWQPIAVVSAAGDLTDELIEQARQLSPEPPQRELDALLATGEQRSAALMAIVLERFGAPARSFSGWQAGLYTEEKHGEAKLRRIEPGRLLRALAAGEIPVVAGFQGLTPGGEISTLGRGGSDTTAVALAAALPAERCEIYTDVDGIYTADPRLVPEAELLPELDGRDMLALAEAGSQVLQAESVRTALGAGLEICLRSSFTDAPGTLVHALPPEARGAFVGLTRDLAAHTVTLVGREAPAAGEALRDGVLLPAGITVERLCLGENSVSFRVSPGREQEALQTLHRAVFSQD